MELIHPLLVFYSHPSLIELPQMTTPAMMGTATTITSAITGATPPDAISTLLPLTDSDLSKGRRARPTAHDRGGPSPISKGGEHLRQRNDAIANPIP